jgi:hypothetical protein
MTYENALMIAAAFYAVLTAGATWLCVFIFDPLTPIRRDKKARRYLVIGFALLCFLFGYGMANAEMVNGALGSHFRPPQCESQSDLGYCTSELQAIWSQRVEALQAAFWHWTLIPPMTRPICTTVSHHVCLIVRNPTYGTPNGWFFIALMRGGTMSATALVVGWTLTRPSKRQLTQEEEALLSLMPPKMRTVARRRMH